LPFTIKSSKGVPLNGNVIDSLYSKNLHCTILHIRLSEGYNAVNNKQTMNFKDIELPSNKKFGLFFSFIFALITIVLFFKEYFDLSILFLFLMFIFISISYTNAQLLLPLNKLWMRIGLILGVIISPVVMGLIFFFIFTPVGLFMRVIGRDELLLKFKLQHSYWKLRDQNDSSVNSFKNQF